jgi:hypothetical protein
MAGTTQTIRVKDVGEHEVKVIVDNARLIDDANRANNTLALKFTWLSSADNEIKIGQKDPSPVEINWIGWDDYRKLEAKQAKFEQAALQKSVTPTPDATTMPLDPTPPGRNQPAVVSQPSPPPAPAKQASPATPKMIAKAEPDPKPAVQNVPPAAKPLDPKQAPAMAKAEAKLAAAPKQDEKPQPPVKLEAKGKTDQAQLMTGDKPADKPVAAPPMNLKPARDFALSSKPVPSNPGPNASLPEPVKNGKIADVSEKHAPQIAPDSKSNPDNKSRRIDGEPNQPPMLAVLPTKPQLKDPAGSPQKQTPEKNVPVDRTQQAPQKPVDPVKKTADGNQQQPTPEMQPTPASPAQKPVPPSPPPQPASSARPTPAPKTERESAPVTLIQGLKIHPGKVLAQQGLQINTVNARFSTVAMMTSAPINPDVVVVFNKTGEVAKAEIIRSTGYANIDGPILASLYKWTAQGEILQKVPATLTIQVHILLGPE